MLKEFFQADSHTEKNKLGPFLVTYIKLNSKWIRDLNVRARTIQLLKEIIRINVKLDNSFLAIKPKAQVTKAKNR